MCRQPPTSQPFVTGAASTWLAGQEDDYDEPDDEAAAPATASTAPPALPHSAPATAIAAPVPAAVKLTGAGTWLADEDDYDNEATGAAGKPTLSAVKPPAAAAATTDVAIKTASPLVAPATAVQPTPAVADGVSSQQQPAGKFITVAVLIFAL